MRKYSNLIIPIIIALLLMPALDINAQNETESLALFPESDMFDGWTLKDSVQVYFGNELYNHVGETSGLYGEFGFIKSMMGVYTNATAVKIQLDVFEMTAPDASWGIFTMNSSGKGQAKQVGDISKMYDYYIHFVKGNYYIRCTTSVNDSVYLNMIMQFGEFVESKIGTTAKKPAVMLAFNFENRIVSQEKYFKGQIGLNEVFEFGHGSIAGFKEGASSRYQEKMFFVFSYADERKRREWFASAKGKMKMNKRFSGLEMTGDGFMAKDKNGNDFLFKPYQKFILIVRGYDRQEGEQVFKRMENNLDKANH